MVPNYNVNPVPDILKIKHKTPASHCPIVFFNNLSQIPPTLCWQRTFSSFCGWWRCSQARSSFILHTSFKHFTSLRSLPFVLYGWNVWRADYTWWRLKTLDLTLLFYFTVAPGLLKCKVGYDGIFAFKKKIYTCWLIFFCALREYFEWVHDEYHLLQTE